jgi:hypothetical protein
MIEITEKKIEDWKKQYGEIFEIEVPKDDSGIEVYRGYLRKPDRKTLSYVMAIQAKNPIAAKEALLENCFMGGDNEIKTEDDAFMSACTVLDSLIVIRLASIKKK